MPEEDRDNWIWVAIAIALLCTALVVGVVWRVDEDPPPAPFNEWVGEEPMRILEPSEEIDLDCDGHMRVRMDERGRVAEWNCDGSGTPSVTVEEWVGEDDRPHVQKTRGGFRPPYLDQMESIEARIADIDESITACLELLDNQQEEP